MSLPVRTVSRLLTPLFFAYAMYLVVTGVYSPGGAFGGGVVIGVVACLGIVAQEHEGGLVLDSGWAHSGRNLGFALILLAGTVTLLVSGSFLGTGALLGAGMITGSPIVVSLAFATGMVVGGEMVIAVVRMLETEVVS